MVAVQVAGVVSADAPPLEGVDFYVDPPGVGGAARPVAAWGEGRGRRVDSRLARPLGSPASGRRSARPGVPRRRR